MSDFAKALDFVLENEQGLSENPKDPGGITKYGISLRFLRSVSPDRLKSYFIFDDLSDETIKNLTLEQANKIYYYEFWSLSLFEEIKNQDVCNYIFDMAINMGVSPAIKCVQRSIWAIEKSRVLVEDGILGDITINKINKYLLNLLPAMRSERAGDYRVITAIHPDQKEFINGWLNRAYQK